MRSDEMPEHLNDVKLAYETIMNSSNNIVRIDANLGIEEIFRIIKKNISEQLYRLKK